MLCDDLDGWDGGVGGKHKGEGMCVCVCVCVYTLIHVVVQQRPAQHCKSTILQLKK